MHIFAIAIRILNNAKNKLKKYYNRIHEKPINKK